MRHLILIAACSFAAAGGQSPLERSAESKLAAIESGRLASGSRVELTGPEINALIADQMPPGVRQPHLTLGHGIATGTALVDFLKVRQARGERPGFLLRRLLDGERPVSVTARVRSRQGQATVDLERVEVSGIEIEGRALEFLIRNFLKPAYPEAKVGEPFALGHRIERLEIQPTAVGVVIGRTK